MPRTRASPLSSADRRAGRLARLSGAARARQRITPVQRGSNSVMLGNGISSKSAAISTRRCGQPVRHQPTAITQPAVSPRSIYRTKGDISTPSLSPPLARRRRPPPPSRQVTEIPDGRVRRFVQGGLGTNPASDREVALVRKATRPLRDDDAMREYACRLRGWPRPRSACSSRDPARGAHAGPLRAGP